MSDFDFPKGVHVNRVRMASNEYSNPDGSWRRYRLTKIECRY